MSFQTASQQCTSKIELTISCRNLQNKDITSLSDPYCVVFIKESWQARFFEIGRTEIIRDCLSPEWVKKFIIDYNFETIQKCRFEIWDHDPSNHDFLGVFETTVADLVSFPSRQYVKPLRGVKPDNVNRGELVVVTEEVSSCKLVTNMTLAADNLPKSMLSKPDTFLVISRSNEDGTFSVVYKTKSVRSSTNPQWNQFQLQVRTLCNGDFDRSVKLDVYKWKPDGLHKLVGSCFSSLRELISNYEQMHPNLPNGPTQLSLKPNIAGGPSGLIINKPNNSKSKLVESKLIIREISVTQEITFLDYIKSGTQIHFALAIDFTASNGPITDRQSLHYLDPSGTNQNPYEIALYAIGEIVAQYDTSGMFPAFGFGAKLPPSGEVSHQFPLNFNPAHPYCTNISDMVTHYRNCLSKITFFGPTNFSPVINNTANIAAKFADGKHYFVLLILTDGIISDMNQTKRAIINASGYPLSLLIIGVGNADFSAMDELDSDNRILSVDGMKAERDIVQFVPLNKFLSPNVSGVRSQADLAREVLAEIPDQVTGYMKKNKFTPLLVPQEEKCLT